MDALLTTADIALRTLFAKAHGGQIYPAAPHQAAEVGASEQAYAAALMRVNHVGEVCAQALYAAQALATNNPELRAHFIQAGVDETNHLAWTEQRLQELGSRKSLLNPLWYAGAFGLGLIAGRMGNRVSLGFVAETEKQVGEHLKSHLAFDKHGLPEGDLASRAIVSQMVEDELRHANEAQAAGAAELPQVVKKLMRAAAKVMTTIAHRV